MRGIVGIACIGLAGGDPMAFPPLPALTFALQKQCFSRKLVGNEIN